jgi:mannan endo-1,6-alpha-mannosidase
LQTNGSAIWEQRLNGLVNRTIDVFFPNGIATEVTCELATNIQCTTDQLSFKGYLHRWLAASTQIAPQIHDTIMATLRTSAAAAAKSCAGGDNGRQCGFRWNTGGYDGLTGAGQEMSALGAISSLLVDEEEVTPPLTSKTGGNSTGNAAAGQDPNVLEPLPPVTTGERAGASILTAVVLTFFAAVWIFQNTRWMEGGRTEYSKANQ